MSPTADGLVVVDKPAGLTSHDVVARIRRLAGTRKVGHAGTLDPMATGVLVLGVDRATRLLGHLALTDKAYDATIRLGATTVTDDAEGEVVATADASGVTAEAVAAVVAGLTGDIQQVPSAVSAIKVDGQRVVQAGPRGRGRRARGPPGDGAPVRRRRPAAGRGRCRSTSTCTSSAPAAPTCGRWPATSAPALGVGGHLTALRRTRVGPYGLDVAHTLEELADDLVVLPIADAARAAFPARDVDAAAATVVSHGGPLPATGVPGPVAVFGPDGALPGPGRGPWRDDPGRRRLRLTPRAQLVRRPGAGSWARPAPTSRPGRCRPTRVAVLLVVDAGAQRRGLPAARELVAVRRVVAADVHDRSVGRSAVPSRANPLCPL